MTRRAHVVAAACCALVAAAPARADQLGVLAVAEAPGPAPELALLTGRLGAALAGRTPGVLEAARLRERMVDAPSAAALAEVDAAYAATQASHAAGDYEAAVAGLRALADALERLPESPEVAAQWTRALLRLARSEQELGHRVEAQAVLERLLRADLEARIDTRQFPPSFVALLEEARQRLRSLGTRRLVVDAPGARVVVDGRDLGPAPVAAELPPGRHRVSARRDGLRLPAVAIEVEQDRMERLDPALLQQLRPDAGPGLALAGDDGAAAAAAARLGLDRTVVVRMLHTGDATWLTAALHDLRRATIEREGRVLLAAGGAPVGALDALAAYLLTGQPSLLVATPTGPSLAPELAGELAPGLAGLGKADAVPRGRLYGWGAAGTAAVTVAATVAAVAYAISAGHHRDAIAANVGNPATYSQADYDSEHAAWEADSTRAWVSAGIAGAAAIGTAVLGYLSYRDTGDVGPFGF